MMKIKQKNRIEKEIFTEITGRKNLVKSTVKLDFEVDLETKQLIIFADAAPSSTEKDKAIIELIDEARSISKSLIINNK